MVALAGACAAEVEQHMGALAVGGAVLERLLQARYGARQPGRGLAAPEPAQHAGAGAGGGRLVERAAQVARRRLRCAVPAARGRPRRRARRRPSSRRCRGSAAGAPRRARRTRARRGGSPRRGGAAPRARRRRRRRRRPTRAADGRSAARPGRVGAGSRPPRARRRRPRRATASRPVSVATWRISASVPRIATARATPAASSDRRMSRTATARSTVSGASVPMRPALACVGCQPSAATARTSSPSKKQLPSVIRQQASAKASSAAGSSLATSSRAPSRVSARGRTGRAGGMRRDLSEQVVGRAGLAEAPCDDDRDVHRRDALQDVQQQPQRRAVGPVRVVDRDQHRAGLGEVRQQPEEAVDDAVGAVVGLVAEPARRALEQRPGERRRAGQQAVVGLVVGARQQRLEELQRDAEGEVALELRRARVHDGRPVRQRLRDGRVEQRRLADAGMSLDEQQLPVARARGIEQVVDGAQLGTPARAGRPIRGRWWRVMRVWSKDWGAALVCLTAESL